MTRKQRSRLGSIQLHQLVNHKPDIPGPDFSALKCIFGMFIRVLALLPLGIFVIYYSAVGENGGKRVISVFNCGYDKNRRVPTPKSERYSSYLALRLREKNTKRDT